MLTLPVRQEAAVKRKATESAFRAAWAQEQLEADNNAALEEAFVAASAPHSITHADSAEQAPIPSPVSPPVLGVDGLHVDRWPTTGMFSKPAGASLAPVSAANVSAQAPVVEDDPYAPLPPERQNTAALALYYSAQHSRLQHSFGSHCFPACGKANCVAPASGQDKRNYGHGDSSDDDLPSVMSVLSAYSC